MINAIQQHLIALGVCAAMLNVSANIALASDQAAKPAEQQQANRAEKVPGGTSDLFNATLALQLFRYGQEKDDAMVILAAARMLAAIDENLTAAVESDAIERETPKSSAEPAPKAGNPQPPDVNQMVAAARQAARGDGAILAMIDQFESTAKKAFISSDRIRKYTTVDAYEEDPWRWRTARGGEWAQVRISGDGDTDLDLYVYDEYGDLVCASEGRGDNEFCRWVPRYTGQFRIIVKNWGSVYNTYYMIIQ